MSIDAKYSLFFNIQWIAKPFTNSVLDLSFNNIKRMHGFETLVNLKELYFANNKLRQITEGMKNLTCLEYLELGFNRIRQIKNLECTISLQSLWLGKNKITEIEVA